MTKNVMELNETLTFDLIVGAEWEGQKHIDCEIREMTGIDEENIAKPDVRSNIGKLITTLLSGIVVRIGDLTPSKVGKAKWEGIIRNLYLGDRDLIMLKLHELTHGNELELNMRCPRCNEKFIHVLDIHEDIENRPLTVDPARFTVELPKGFKDNDTIIKEAVLRLPTGEDQEQLDAIARRNPGQANTMLITRCLKELGSARVSSNTVRQLSVRDREALVKAISDNMFGPNFLINMTCPHCGEEIEQGVNPINFI